MDSSDSELEAFIPASLHKRSPIHNYFTYKKETNKSVCKKLVMLRYTIFETFTLSVKLT
jgi:hypothetical protein